MNIVIRCRRCGAEFVIDRVAVVVPGRRLCPPCRGPLPPTGGVPAMEGGPFWTFPSRAAA